MSLSEMLAIMVMFPTSYAKNFKYFYKSYMDYLHQEDFPKALSDNRFVELMPRMLMPLNTLLQVLCGEETELYFMDATTIKVCPNKRR